MTKENKSAATAKGQGRIELLSEAIEVMRFALNYLVMPVDVEARLAKEKILNFLPKAERAIRQTPSAPEEPKSSTDSVPAAKVEEIAKELERTLQSIYYKAASREFDYTYSEAQIDALTAITEALASQNKKGSAADEWKWVKETELKIAAAGSRPEIQGILLDALASVPMKEEEKGNAALRIVELFGSWLDHWSIKVNKQSHEVYGAWDECRARADKEILEEKDASTVATPHEAGTKSSSGSGFPKSDVAGKTEDASSSQKLWKVRHEMLDIGDGALHDLGGSEQFVADAHNATLTSLPCPKCAEVEKELNFMRFQHRQMSEQENKDIAELEQLRARLESEEPCDAPTQLFLCEINRLILHENQLYTFKAAPGCQKCADYLIPSHLYPWHKSELSTTNKRNE